MIDPCASLTPRRALRIATLFLAFAATGSLPAAAQAWPAPSGVGSVNVTFQVIDNAGHRLTDGSLIEDGKSVNLGVFVDTDYAITDRLSVTVGVPYVFSRYTGPHPSPPPIPSLPSEECRCWNHGVQDFGLTARYNVLAGVFGLTPSIAVGLPSRGYDFRGEAAIGYHLREVRLAADAGVRLDRILPNLSLQGRYQFAIVEKAVGVSHNRSNSTVTAGYLIGRRVAARGFAEWQHTHGGLRLGSLPPTALEFPGEVNTEALLFQHDRLLRDNHLNVGAGLAYSLPAADLFVSYVGYVKGTDSHAGRVVTAGISWPFEISRP